MLSSVQQEAKAMANEGGLIRQGPPQMKLPLFTPSKEARSGELDGLKEALAQKPSKEEAADLKKQIAEVKSNGFFQPDGDAALLLASSYALVENPVPLQWASNKRKEGESSPDPRIELWKNILNDPKVAQALDCLEVGGKSMVSLRVLKAYRKDFNPLSQCESDEDVANQLRTSIFLPSVARTILFSNYKAGIYNDSIESMPEDEQDIVKTFLGTNWSGVLNLFKSQSGAWTLPDGFEWCASPARKELTKKEVESIKTKEVADLRAELASFSSVVSPITPMKIDPNFVMAKLYLVDPTLTQMANGEWVLMGRKADA